MKQTIKAIKKELRKNIDPKYNLQMFFKHKITCLKVRYPNCNKIAKEFYKELKDLPKDEFISICEKLQEQKYTEEKTVGIVLLRLYRHNLTKKDFPRMERWVKTYLTDWALCDTFVPYIIHDLITAHSELISKVKKWTKSKNLYVRRAACVAFLRDGAGVKPTLHDKENIFWVAEQLMFDKEDLVQKGYGWLLKNASKKHPKEVFQFVLNHKHHMPRTALRYAIEYYPQNMRKQALSKA